MFYTSSVVCEDSTTYFLEINLKINYMEKKIRKGTLVICSLYGGDIAKINYYNPLNGEVGLRYKGSKCEYSANINDCKIV